jgi:hypothetical protein
MEQLVEKIYGELLKQTHLESVDPHEPVVVFKLPFPWQVLGAGNYAAVFCHPDYPDRVVKVYAPGRPGIEEEIEVYHRLGQHPAYSECYYAGENFLVLRRLHGVTLYDCLQRGIRIPKRAIQDVERALTYARDRGLFPHDVHGRNVMVLQGRGVIVDVSDFLHRDPCSAWADLRRAYYWVYLPFLSVLRIRVSPELLDGVRRTYRHWRNWWRR